MRGNQELNLAVLVGFICVLPRPKGQGERGEAESCNGPSDLSPIELRVVE